MLHASSRSQGSRFGGWTGLARAGRLTASGALAAALLVLSSGGCGQDGRVREGGSGGDAGGGGGSGGAGGAGGSGGGAPKDPMPLRVVNWNVRNYLNDKNDSAAVDEVVRTTAQYVAHRKEIGVVLSAIDADVVVLQEVENEASLSDLVQNELGGKYTSIGIVDGNDPRGIDIAILSKLPIDQVVSHKDEQFPLNGTVGPTYRFSRDCPEYHLTYNGRKIVLLGVHFKAKEDDNPNKRLAEAQRTRAIANALVKEDPSRAVLVLGDFNDTPGSPPHLAVMGEGDGTYTNAPDFVPTNDRWTYDYQGTLELVDHQMSNPLLAGMLDQASVTIRHGDDVDAATDHAPVVATYGVK
ncbi:endonuclease/exonuclease/phosphatase family protein [Polyangium sp. 15x6]|uniref:endonuclease/exonuclease/phosphatase family protein n=1 Tax=Polyangium sp. 15x6 TaxID=3042687 RepID=UPI00249B6C28|nr:endonuclease/exonuclease/phosphatase family protein [Polyangium sp. 15x6]MDI3290865.1 endonuclease/exonuclease/phosphatase family protein [Polyangium sp. 15x6]